MQMDRMTVKSSTIFIAVGKRTHVYQSLADVPAPLRQRLEESTNGVNSATILIADKRGREEIVRALRGLPSELRSRLTSSLSSSRARKRSASTTAPVPRAQTMPTASTGMFLTRYWVEFVVPAGVGLLIWLTLQYVGR